MSSKRKRNRFSIDLKYKIIQLIDNKIPYEEIVDQFKSEKIKIKNIYQINSMRKKIIKAFENRSNECTNAKSIKQSSYDKLDKALYDFVLEQTSNGVEVDSLMIKEKGDKLAKMFGYHSFKNSKNFIDGFKTRYSRFFTKNHRKTKTRPKQMSSSFSDDTTDVIIPQIIEDYEQSNDQIINDFNEYMSEDEMEEEENEEEESEEEETIDLFDAIDCMSRLRKFVRKSDLINQKNCFLLLKQLENEFNLYRNRLKTQTVVNL